MAPKPFSSKSKTKAPALPTPARLLLRIHSAKGLHYGVFSHGVYCKMYVGETAMLNGSDKGLFGGKSDTTDTEHSTYKVFRTKTIPQPANAESDAVWDENFDVYVPDTTRDILSIRVKSKHRLYPSVLGVCAVQLKQLKIGHSVDKWVALHKGTREVATLRLQIVLSPIVDPQKVLEGSKPDLQADIKTALAANQSAEEAIERLLASGKFSNRGGTVIVFDNEDNQQTSTTETQTEQLQEQPSKDQEKTEELQPKKHEDNQQTSTTETHTKQVQVQPIKGQEKSEELKKNGTTTSIEHVPVVPTAFST